MEPTAQDKQDQQNKKENLMDKIRREQAGGSAHTSIADEDEIKRAEEAKLKSDEALISKGGGKSFKEIREAHRGGNINFSNEIRDEDKTKRSRINRGLNARREEREKDRAAARKDSKGDRVFFYSEFPNYGFIYEYTRKQVKFAGNYYSTDDADLAEYIMDEAPDYVSVINEETYNKGTNLNPAPISPLQSTVQVNKVGITG